MCLPGDRLKAEIHTCSLVIELSRLVASAVSQVRYIWRKLTAGQREQLLEWRKKRQQPWHSPPHQSSAGSLIFHISAACYGHVPLIGFSKDRIDNFSSELLEVLCEMDAKIYGWCVLPN